MCTAISIFCNNHYFGRNLDLEQGYGEKIVITPRNYPFRFSSGKLLDSHSALIGVALPYNGYPLYFDGVNEHGLAIAGLNFPDNACYFPPVKNRLCIASYELIPYVLTACKNVSDALALLDKAVITDTAFSKELQPSPLHWMISDKNESAVIEQTKDGMKLYKNPVGVLSNNPQFSFHLTNLNNYLSASPNEPQNRFSEKLALAPYSKGMGGIGIPGDMSSSSRFIRAAFTLNNAVFSENDSENIIQCFNILRNVQQIKGCVKTVSGYETTLYTAVCNTEAGVYYYTTCFSSAIKAVGIKDHPLDSNTLIAYEMKSYLPE